MTLTAGTRLGSYIIEAPLGAGGMGEVYRARDSKLQRQVALKVLPELLASDPDRRSRFERLGIFKYSQEEGSRAAGMPGQVPAKIKNSRYRAAMEIQQSIAHDLAREKIGNELKLLVDQPHVARSEADAPDVDARVILSESAPVGEFIRRTIKGTRNYDLLA